MYGSRQLWDAINDSLIGWLSDRTRWGKRHPCVLRGAIPFGIFVFLQWVFSKFGLGFWLSSGQFVLVLRHHCFTLEAKRL
ncbi:MFS transporter [Oculatella sp. LEGE 06141]|uniref:MFS transporter n=1 Tax=Oculatella sp. LEGE 06141 TaxID=1828648 RepID=UPI001882F506|nr:MFS transporter [Oculatella sp. LEGE 06141]MBE9178098.1 MFS transporter [Oculatella sp. LEGE 06141]